MKTAQEMLKFYQNLQERFPKLTFEGAVLRIQYQFNIPQAHAIALITGQPITSIGEYREQKRKEVRAHAESNPYIQGITRSIVICDRPVRKRRKTYR